MLWFSKELLKRAKAGYPREQYDIANCYKHGLGIKLNEKAAVKWYEKAAKQGHVEASEALADCYFNGAGVKYSGRKAIEWYEKAVELGSKTAAYSLAMCYESLGMINRENGHNQVKLLRIAAEAGVKAAAYKLGEIYESARFQNYPDKKEAREYYLMAKDYSDAADRADRLKAVLLDMGLERKLTSADIERFNNLSEMELYEHAKLGITEAQFILAVAYENGRFSNGMGPYMLWYENAAKGGHPGAKVRLAIDHLSRRDYRDTNLRRAYQYLTEARAAGYNAAEIDRLISTIPAEYRK